MFKQFGMFGFLQFLKYWIVFGMLLMLSEWIIENIHIMQLRRNTKKQDAEILKLKAELYNYLHDAKKVEGQKTEVIEAVKPAIPPTDTLSTKSDSTETPPK
jgi:hypothetical protein